MKLDQLATMMNTAQVPLIVLFIAPQVNITAQQDKMKMAVTCQIAVRKKREASTENCAHSTAQNYVQSNKYFVKEDLTKPAAELQAHAEINNNIDGDLELQLNLKKNVQDLAQLYAKLMKSYVLHS